MFPIDSDIKNEVLVDELFSFLNIPITTDTVDYVRNWKPVNATENWELFKREKEIDPFEHLKRASINNDIEAIREYLSIEFDYLRNNAELKEEFKKLGYRNLSWF